MLVGVRQHQTKGAPTGPQKTLPYNVTEELVVKTRRGQVFLKKSLAQSPTLVSQITFGPLLYIVSEPFIYPHFREKYW